jgi:hypothetical protein
LVWQRVGSLPDGCEREFQFAAVAAHGGHAWLAGSPGSRIWYSGDNARTWQAFPTGEVLPIRDLHFLDEKRGWSAGSMGTILATDDGGRTWRRQLGGGKRAAVLGVYGRVAAIPWELLAHTSAAQGYRTHVEMLAGEGAPGEGQTPRSARFEEALGQLGASGAMLSTLPIPDASLQLSAGQTLADWDQRTGISCLQELTEALVRTIRMWRPEAVVTQETDTAGDGIERVLFQMVRDAVELSGEETAYRNQIAVAGSPPGA